MKISAKTALTAIATAAAVAIAAAASAAGYVPEKWNLEARRKFAEQRFGIFIHWGIYANYAQGEWYQQKSGLDTETYGRMKDGFCEGVGARVQGRGREVRDDHLAPPRRVLPLADEGR